MITVTIASFNCTVKHVFNASRFELELDVLVAFLRDLFHFIHVFELVHSKNHELRRVITLPINYFASEFS